MKKFLKIAFCLFIISFMVLCNCVCQAKDLYKNDKEITLSQVKEVRASHILVKTKEQAESIREDIINGRSFAEAAKEYSLCPSGKQGGDLGYFGHGVMVPEFDKAAFELPLNTVSEPIKTQFGWHLLIVNDQR